jgi:hypothetical protein
MRRLLKRDQAAGLALTLAGLISLVGFVAPTGRALADGPVSISDPAGDTINRDTNQKLAAPAADILSATVDSGAQGIVLTFKTQQMADPATDPNWASPNTFVSWQVDDNGDGKVDDLIRFSADRTTPGGITGDLTHWSGPGIPAKHCDAQPGFDPAVGYSLTIAASCVANPAAISYRVQITYDTQPSAAKPPLAFDVAPDQGLAGPVPIFVPTAPAQAPPAAGAPANGGTPAAGTPTAPAGGGTPTSAKPAAPAKPAAKPPTTAPARRPSSSALATRAPAATTPTTTPTAPRPDLAATGPGAARALGALAGALLLLGGFTLMVPPERRRRPA